MHVNILVGKYFTFLEGEKAYAKEIGSPKVKIYPLLIAKLSVARIFACERLNPSVKDVRDHKRIWSP